MAEQEEPVFADAEEALPAQVAIVTANDGWEEDIESDDDCFV